MEFVIQTKMHGDVLWSLRRSDGTDVCVGGDVFRSVAEARSDIARAKKSMKGAWRCKVVEAGRDAD